jgi:hypothetical protein
VTDAELARLLLVVAKRLEDDLQPSSGGLVRHPAGATVSGANGSYGAVATPGARTRTMCR